jgi:hypothetical protein
LLLLAERWLLPLPVLLVLRWLDVLDDALLAEGLPLLAACVGGLSFLPDAAWACRLLWAVIPENAASAAMMMLSLVFMSSSFNVRVNSGHRV